MTSTCMRYNVDKCKVMEFSRSGKSHFAESELLIGALIGDLGSRSALAVVDTEKDLGVTFSSNLKFNNHIKTQANRATSILGQLKRTFARCWTIDTCWTIYEWNALPAVVTGCDLVNQFKNRYDAYKTGRQVFVS